MTLNYQVIRSQKKTHFCQKLVMSENAGLSTRPAKLRSGQCGDWVRDYTPRLPPLITSAKCDNYKHLANTRKEFLQIY